MIVKNKIIVGLTTRVVIFGDKNKKEMVARIDTGATKSSLDISVAKELGLGPELKRALVKTAHGLKYRPIVLVNLAIGGEIRNAEFTLADRKHMKYKALIGQNILKRGFLIDPSKRLE